jgi:hypothetical protein
MQILTGSISHQIKEKKVKQVSKAVFVSVILFVALIATAKSKRYEVVFNTAVQTAHTQLKPGTYELEVDGGTATFYQGKKEICKVAVRTEEVAKKIDATGVETSGDKITSIELGGTKTKLIVTD